MATDTMRILKDVLKLSPKERANLADKILSSLDQPNEYIDNLWSEEVEDRINAYKKGKIKAVSLKEVLAKYQK